VFKSTYRYSNIVKNPKENTDNLFMFKSDNIHFFVMINTRLHIIIETAESQSAVFYVRKTETSYGGCGVLLTVIDKNEFKTSSKL